MKKLLYILIAVVCAGFVACSDQNDVVDDLYKQIEERPIVKSIDYTLTEADYGTISTAAGKNAVTQEEKDLAAAVKSSNSLNSFANSIEYVPAVLAAKYPGLGLESAVRVSYAITPDYLAPIGKAPTYTLKAADYASVWGAESTTAYLTPANAPADVLPTILDAAYPDAELNDIVVASYKYSNQEPVTIPGDDEASPILLSESFEEYTDLSTSYPYSKWDQNSWTSLSTEGNGDVYFRVRGRSGAGNYSEVTANDEEGESVAWVVSPQIDLSKTTNNIVTFDLVVAFWNADCLSVLVTDDAKALTDPESVAWDDITGGFIIPQAPTNGYGPMTSAGVVSLDAYDGKKIYIAFRYEGSFIVRNDPANRSTTYQIDNFVVAGISTAAPRAMRVARAAAAPTVTENIIYLYNGSEWIPYPNAAIVNPADYEAMGVASLTALTAPNYLPAFVAQKFPYKQPGDRVAVRYGSLVAEYVKDGGVWKPFTEAGLTTDQFINDGTKWIFDPTITHPMVKDDYRIMVEYVRDNPDLNSYFVDDSYANSEFYYGFHFGFDNVSFRLSYRTDYPQDTELQSLGTDEEKVALLWERLEQEALPIFLSLRFPDSPAISNGVALHYNVIVMVYYPNGTQNLGTNGVYYQIRYKVLTAGSAGNPPTFEWVSSTETTNPF